MDDSSDIPLLDHLRTRVIARHLHLDDVPCASTTSTNDAVRQRILNLELEQLPYNLSGARHALYRIEALLRRLVSDALNGIPDDRSHTVGLLAEQALPVAWIADHFLDTARRAQNATTRYIHFTFRVPLPDSLHGLVANPSKFRHKIPRSVWNLVVEYWRTHGETLKAYRDLAQHHVIVSSDAWVRGTSGAPEIHLLLPSNPREPSPGRLQYDSPHVHLSTFCRTAFASLWSFATELTCLLLRHTGIGESTTRSLLRHAMPLGDQSSFVSLPCNDLNTFVSGIREHAHASAVRKFGNFDKPPPP
jgi:hypothetical protein